MALERLRICRKTAGRGSSSSGPPRRRRRRAVPRARSFAQCFHPLRRRTVSASGRDIGQRPQHALQTLQQLRKADPHRRARSRGSDSFLRRGDRSTGTHAAKLQSAFERSGHPNEAIFARRASVPGINAKRCARIGGNGANTLADQGCARHRGLHSAADGVAPCQGLRRRLNDVEAPRPYDGVGAKAHDKNALKGVSGEVIAAQVLDGEKASISAARPHVCFRIAARPRGAPCTRLIEPLYVISLR
jgi:hypothetical protein